MTRDATASEETSSRSYWGFVILAVIIISTALVYAITERRPAASLTVLRYSTNSVAPWWNHKTNNVTFVRALVLATNHTMKAFMIGAPFASRHPSLAREWCYCVLSQTNSVVNDFDPDWLEPGVAGGPVRMLPPRSGFTFEVIVPTDRACRVVILYKNPRKLNRVWSKLPRWVSKRLPWMREWRLATVGLVDLSEAE